MVLFVFQQLAEKEEFEHKQKELEKICMPIMTKIYQGASGVPGGFPGTEGQAYGAGSGGSKGPTIEEVD